MLGSCYKFQISTTLLLIHDTIIVIITNPFCQEFNILVCSAKRKIFVIICVFEIMQFDNFLQFFFNCSCRRSASRKLELLNLSPIGHLPAQIRQ